MKLSKKAKGVQPSATLEITAKAKRLKKEGKKIIAFTAGEPDFNTPDFIVNSAITALKEGFTKYTPSAGIPELRAAIAQVDEQLSTTVVDEEAFNAAQARFEAIRTKIAQSSVPEEQIKKENAKSFFMSLLTKLFSLANRILNKVLGYKGFSNA